jgi:UDP-N-acetylglucosamine:LPS N-acetylglucosamine transferase
MTARPELVPTGTKDGSTSEPAGEHRAPVLLVASSGGHLTQLAALSTWWTRYRRTWVTFNDVQATSLLAGETVRWAYGPTTRNIPNLLRNTVLAVRMLLRERPALIVSTGAGVAVPFIVLGWVLRVPTAFIEVYDRVEMPTLTGRLVRPFATLILVQWQEQLASYPRAVMVGPLL